MKAWLTRITVGAAIALSLTGIHQTAFAAPAHALSTYIRYSYACGPITNGQGTWFKYIWREYDYAWYEEILGYRDYKVLLGKQFVRYEPACGYVRF